jgi:hypothetical protein
MRCAAQKGARRAQARNAPSCGPTRTKCGFAITSVTQPQPFHAEPIVPTPKAAGHCATWARRLHTPDDEVRVVSGSDGFEELLPAQLVAATVKA